MKETLQNLLKINFQIYPKFPLTFMPTSLPAHQKFAPHSKSYLIILQILKKILI